MSKAEEKFYNAVKAAEKEQYSGWPIHCYDVTVNDRLTVTITYDYVTDIIIDGSRWKGSDEEDFMIFERELTEDDYEYLASLI